MAHIESDPRYSFDTFVVGTTNRLAVAASRAVAQAPGSSYNPLFVYGASGLGKTHLLVAVGQLALKLHPGLRIRYVPLDEWVDELHAAVASARMDAFKTRYHEVDMLILDDVQFLAGRRETQSEMLRLFNFLHRGGCQIILASDRAPTEISDLDQRLLTRLSGGLIVDLDMPDYETRVAILQRKCEERDARFETGVIEAVARLGHGNVRELQGALTRLVAFQRLGEIAVTSRNVCDLLGAEASPEAPAPAASNEFGNFLSDISVAVAQHIESWRARLGEAVATWNERGYRTASLERALSGHDVPDVDVLLQSFAAAVARLQALERKAAASDPALARSEVFRNPDRLAEAEALAAGAPGVRRLPPQPEARFSRDTFETGSSNQFAIKAADAVVREPGRRYNPLYIHGSAGTGKSHLGHSIGSEMLASSGGAHTVAVLGADAFSQELITALQEGAIDTWRARYRSLDVLILDDVQNLTGKAGTQEEFFHLFNALFAEGKQIVLMSDRAPRALEGVEERLRSRFEGGLVVEIERPDQSLRERLYARALSTLGHEPNVDLVSYLAARTTATATEISEAAKQLVLHLGDVKELTVAAAQTVFGKPRESAGSGKPAHRVVTSRVTAIASEDGSFFLPTDKTIWDWPDVGGRLIEELR